MLLNTICNNNTSTSKWSCCGGAEVRDCAKQLFYRGACVIGRIIIIIIIIIIMIIIIIIVKHYERIYVTFFTATVLDYHIRCVSCNGAVR